MNNMNNKSTLLSSSVSRLHSRDYPRCKSVAKSQGFTLVEMILAMSIAALLAVAVGVALNASLVAYSSATEMASVQTSARLVSQRLLTIIRKSTLHDAYDPNDGTVTLLPPTDANYPLETVGMQMRMPDGDEIRIWWAVNEVYEDADLGDLWVQDMGLLGASPQAAQPMLDLVQCQRTAGGDPYLFTLGSRPSAVGLLLSRATVDLMVYPRALNDMGLESAKATGTPIRLVGSSMPRKTMEMQ